MWPCPICKFNCYSDTCGECNLGKSQRVQAAVAIDSGIELDEVTIGPQRMRSTGRGRTPLSPIALPEIAADSVFAIEVRSATRNVVAVSAVVLATIVVVVTLIGNDQLLQRRPTLPSGLALVGVVLSCLIGAIAVTALRRALCFQRDPKLHPALRPMLDRTDIADRFGEILSKARVTQRAGKIRCTTSWLIVPSFFSLRLMPFVDTVWATMTSRTTVTMISLVPIYADTQVEALLVYDASCRRFSIGISDYAQGAELLHLFLLQAPWMLVGGRELDKVWRDDPVAVIEFVESRRRQVLPEPGDREL